MKKFFSAGLLAGLFFVLLVPGLHAQDAAGLVEKSRNRIQSNTVSQRSRMVLNAKDGSTTERLLDQYSKDGPKGHRQVIVFQRPAGIANTRFLTMENPGKSDDQWIFLPSLGKIRRVAASEGSGSFMGTDLSYDDLSSMDRDPGLDNHRLLREESLGPGRDCYVIESVPKNSSWQYSKMVQYIDKGNFAILKAELFDKKGNMVKVLENSDFKEVQGRLSSMVTKMTTLAAGTSTTIITEILKYDDPIPEGVFTTSFLETGRNR